MRTERVEADLGIIGAGVAGRSLAYRASQAGLKPVLLDDGRKGTTHSATGLLAPRLDYMLRDINLVRDSDIECFCLKVLFPEIIKPMQFLLPIYPEHRRRFSYIEALLKKYNEITPYRRACFPPSSRIPRQVLKKTEPNLRNDYFDGALSFWETTVDPDDMLREFDLLNLALRGYRKVIVSPRSLKFELKENQIKALQVSTRDGNDVRISNQDKPFIVVNAAGPWIQDIVAPLGITLNIVLRLGIQMAVPGHFFQSAIISLNEGGKGCICLPKENFLQVGPTNTLFSGHPDNIEASPDDMNDLLSTLRSVLRPDVRIEGHRFLKAGLRVKPRYGDTNRPIIWSHDKEGFENLYTLFPGKMSLGLLAANEMLQVLAKDGWFRLNDPDPALKHALDGNKEFLNWLFLKKEHARSLIEIGAHLFLFK